MSTNWCKKILKENMKEIVASAAFLFVFAFVMLLWHYILGKKFEWVEISPISMPDIPSRLFYSILTYWTIGRFLYKIYFYKILSIILGQIFGKWKLYDDTKDVIWNFLLFLMFFYIIPKTVDLLNAIISFFYNIFCLILYLFPPFGISLVLCIIVIYFIKKNNIKIWRTQNSQKT